VRWKRSEKQWSSGDRIRGAAKKTDDLKDSKASYPTPYVVTLPVNHKDEHGLSSRLASHVLRAASSSSTYQFRR
jgi:hypothetical protein